MSPLKFLVLTAEQKADMIQDLKDKGFIDKDYKNVFSDLPVVVRKRVRALRSIQDKHDKLADKYFEERATLEAKYQELFKPLYDERYDIVNGIVEIEKVREMYLKESGETSKVIGVPNFWVNAMKANEIMSKMIMEQDEEILKYLKDIRWSRVDDLTTFKLDFFFNKNPYLKNNVLSKTYMLDEDEHYHNMAIGTEIEWYAEKDVTRSESFFKFFSPRIFVEDEILDEKTAEESLIVSKHDFEIGLIIRDKIIPNTVGWFTEEAKTGDFEDTDDYDSDDESCMYMDWDDDEDEVDVQDEVDVDLDLDLDLDVDVDGDGDDDDENVI
ncbi:nucleosome assembly protein 1;1-like [Impatiens glandulifera]|uniref:nucleosome assembly protein 1;1-like n=1 Tax=Impatiens glandulifera TaxID=253017 RepID=UPI001FB19FB9|nr:nucleosome assembly protein 1;1-like [Impatiens glandulifera]